MLGRESGAPRIVRPARSGVRAALIVAGVLLGVFALYVVYELGRYNAGYDRQAVAQQRTELEVRIEHLARANRELRTRLAESDTVGAGSAHRRTAARAALQLPLPRDLRPAAHRAADLQARAAQRRSQLRPARCGAAVADFRVECRGVSLRAARLKGPHRRTDVHTRFQT